MQGSDTMVEATQRNITVNGLQPAMETLTKGLTTGTQLFRSFMELLPRTVRPGVNENGPFRGELRMSDGNDLQMTFSALRGAIDREMRRMKNAHQNYLVRKGVEHTKKAYLRMRISELGAGISGPPPGELVSLMNELDVMEQHEKCFENIREIMENLSEYKRLLRNLEETDDSMDRPERVGRELELLLSDIMSLGEEADHLVMATSVS